MAKEILKRGEVPRFHGICGVCNTEFIAEVEDCDIEVFELGYTRSSTAHTSCPVCGYGVEVFRLVANKTKITDEND